MKREFKFEGASNSFHKSKKRMKKMEFINAMRTIFIPLNDIYLILFKGFEFRS